MEQLSPRVEATGVVLAGGGSTRMGQNKAALLLGGEPLVRRAVRRLGLALAEVVVAGPEELAPLVPPGTRLVADTQPGQGPLAGITAALRAVSTPWIFVVACDMPFVAPDLLRAMVDLALAPPEVDALELRTARGPEPLHAMYRSSCLPALDAQLAAGDLALRHLLDRIRVREMSWTDAAQFDPAGLSSFNANTPEDWERAQAISQQLLTDI